MHETAVAWIRYRERTRRPATLWTETYSELGTRRPGHQHQTGCRRPLPRSAGTAPSCSRRRGKTHRQLVSSILPREPKHDMPQPIHSIFVYTNNPIASSTLSPASVEQIATGPEIRLKRMLTANMSQPDSGGLRYKSTFTIPLL